MPKVRVAVTGGTGFVGRTLVDRLLERGHEVTVLSRDPVRAESRLPVRVRVAGGPAIEALQGTDAIVHLAGEGIAGGRWTAARKAAILESRERGTRDLIGALERLPGGDRPRALVAASAIGIYGDRGDTLLDEGAPPGTDFLSDVCRRWEAAAEGARALGVRTAIVRIGIVLGPGGGAVSRMLPPFRLGLGGRLGSGRQWMSWIHLDDLVALLLLAVESEALDGVVNGVAPQPVTNREFTHTLGAVLRRPAPFPVPALALRLALGELSTVLLASQRVAASVAERLRFDFRHPTLAGALAAIVADRDTRVVHEQWLPRAPAELFPFFADPRNLERITPPFLGFRVRQSSTPAVQAGTQLDYRLALHGVPVRWRSRITAWEPPRRFVDEQERGPYARWQHTHDFVPHAGGTIVRDAVRYRLPLGVVGELVAGRLVARDLDRIFAFRRQALARLFPAAEGRSELRA
jgi:hypothetical protein